MTVLPSELLALDFESLEQLALFHEQMMALCRARAAHLMTIKKREAWADARAEYLAQAPLLVFELLRKGYNSEESAICAAARQMKLPEFSVAAQLRQFRKESAREYRATRDSVILHLVRLGVRNDEIARRLKCHRNTVSKTIRRLLFPARLRRK